MSPEMSPEIIFLIRTRTQLTRKISSVLKLQRAESREFSGQILRGHPVHFVPRSPVSLQRDGGGGSGGGGGGGGGSDDVKTFHSPSPPSPPPPPPPQTVQKRGHGALQGRQGLATSLFCVFTSRLRFATRVE